MPKAKEMRSRILKARDSKRKAVSVPEWDLETGLYVRSLSVFEALEYGKFEDDDLSVQRYLAYCLVDEDGENVFDPKADLDEITKKDQSVVVRLFKEAMAVNGDDEPKSAEDDAKN